MSHRGCEAEAGVDDVVLSELTHAGEQMEGAGRDTCHLGRFASGPGDYGAGAGAYSNDYRGGGGGVFPMKKEFFLNITVDERDRAEVAGSILKEHGRKALGRAGSVMGGLVGSVAGHANIGDGLIAENLSKTVRQYIEEILEHDGWRCIVKTVMFPPLDGTMWREYISLPNGGIFLTQRVQILHRDTNLVGGPNGSSSWFSHLLNMRECCCPPEAPDYNRYTGNTIVNSLQNKFRGRTPPINPYIDAANAMEEVNHLQRMQGFEPRVAEQVIIRSRGVNGDGR
eukprot:TRINITY_DN13784_c0_g1_i2.p2 TRINITY_DN13784_c0_g1~~TRINITY_DN13784_c0_g1_i2.p2  ORF type:complete len:302 (-),score=61.65 TRINITY_DN13784_c0_g1_i2:57-905(-)